MENKYEFNVNDIDKDVILIAKSLGGFKNIDKLEYCITRLRIVVKNIDLIDDELLKQVGKFGVIFDDKIVQIILGNKTFAIENRFKYYLDKYLETGKDYDVLINDLKKDIIKNEDELRIAFIIEYLGGPTNIEDVDCCATRLRVNVKDNSLVNGNMLKHQGAAGVISNNNYIQVIFGNDVNILKNKILKYLESYQITGEKSEIIKNNFEKYNLNNDKIDAECKKIALIAKGLGGIENICDIDCCATRLRIIVKDNSIISNDMLVDNGAAAVIINECYIQVIFGDIVKEIKVKLEEFFESYIQLNN